jgi:hypothetical protein
MHVDHKKYIGWVFEGISLDGYLFVLTFARYRLSIRDGNDFNSQNYKVKIVFASVKRMTISKLHSGAEIVNARLETYHDDKEYIFELTDDSFIKIVASQGSEFLF